MFSTEVNYEVVTFSVGDTKAGTKMGKLQLKNTEDNSVLNCILWEETLNRFDSKIFRTGNIVRIVSASFNEKYNNCLVSVLELIKEAKTEIINTIRAYNKKDDQGCYTFPLVRQRPILLMGPPGIGKTAIMEQAAAECGVDLVAYTITHHTRQSAIGLPHIESKVYQGKEVSVTEYTLSEIIASVYQCMEETGKKEE